MSTAAAMMREAAVIVLLAAGLGACSSKGPTEGRGTGGNGTGGALTSGGTGSGGVTGTGGSGPGGASTSGGAIGSGGLKGTGGTSGGLTSSGGRTSPGGTTGAGGTLGSGGVIGAGGTGKGGVTGTGGATAGGGAGGSTGLPDGGPAPDAISDDLARAKDAALDLPAPKTDAADGKPAQCPGSSTLKPGDNKATLQFGGRSRSYVVYLPSSVKADTPVPLIFDFHGHGGSASQEESSSGWKKKADQVGVIMVYPDGVDSSWNVGSCCGQAMSENVDDVGFTRAVIEAVSKAACIDAKRIYATGMSNGAGFVERLGCEAADVFAAIAAASADLVTDPCTPARPISELAIRGLADTLVAYEGGNTGSTGWYSPGAKATLDLWKKIDQCTGSATTTRQYCEGYSSCAAGVEIALCSLPNTGHDTYNNAVGMNVPDVAWEMFQRQAMP